MRTFVAACLATASLLGLGGPAFAASFGEVQTSNYRTILGEQVTVSTVHRYSGNPDVLVIDIPTLTEQSRMFNRVVALIERIGAPRDRVLTNEELAEFIRKIGQTELTFAYGNDFRVSELVVFFNLASHGGISLNDEEIRLRDFLLEEKLVKSPYGFLQVNGKDRVILSLPQAQVQQVSEGKSLRITDRARETILRHELSHGEYYANPQYADYCRRFWYTVLSEPERQTFRQFLGGRSYNTRNEEMMINESQAYLMHTPDPAAFNPQRSGFTQAQIDRLRRQFMDGRPPSALFSEY
jgi:hypothetical protein